MVCVKLLASLLNLKHRSLFNLSLHQLTATVPQQWWGDKKKMEKRKKPAAGKSSPANAEMRDLQMGQRCHTAFPSRLTSPKPMMESEIKWTVEGTHSAYYAGAVNWGEGPTPRSSTSRIVTVQWLKHCSTAHWDSAFTDQSMTLYVSSKKVELQPALTAPRLLQQTPGNRNMHSK